jgi:hypothetical protein
VDVAHGPRHCGSCNAAVPDAGHPVTLYEVWSGDWTLLSSNQRRTSAEKENGHPLSASALRKRQGGGSRAHLRPSVPGKKCGAQLRGSTRLTSPMYEHSATGSKYKTRSPFFNLRKLSAFPYIQGVY